MNPYRDAFNISDEQLMEKYQKGDSMAFETLYLRHQDRVYSYLSRRLSDSHSIDEVFQNIFLKFHKVKDQYKCEFPVLKWIYTISRSELYDFCKKKKIHTMPLDENLVAKQNDQEPEFDKALLNSLSVKERAAISLKYLSDKDYDDISTHMNVSKVNARKLVSRGINKLKKKLAGGHNEKQKL
jgi:RNA polymerase sigma-70 factor (ECF subfamily)